MKTAFLVRDQKFPTLKEACQFACIASRLSGMSIFEVRDGRNALLRQFYQGKQIPNAYVLAQPR